MNNKWLFRSFILLAFLLYVVNSSKITLSNKGDYPKSPGTSPLNLGTVRILENRLTKIHVNIKGDKIKTKTDSNYVCWNIDSSVDRQFFSRDLKNPKIKFLAKALGGGYLRFGGTGNDFMTYQFGKTYCSDHPTPLITRADTCLNETHWETLTELSNHANMKLIFGLNIQKRNEPYNTSDPFHSLRHTTWDPTNAREFIKYNIRRNFTFFGFELGNEMNKCFTGSELVETSHRTLDKLLKELYPDSTLRPKILGPDPHSWFAQGMRKPLIKDDKLQFVLDFVDSARSNDIDLFAVTHHEYIEIDNTTFFDDKKLNVTLEIAENFVNQVRQHSAKVDLWAGEIGPHNGGSPPCTAKYNRWSTFGESAWYLDALGSKAKAGYQVFCRQNFIGIDYGLLDCLNADPLPDYFSGLLFQKLMGPEVLSTSIFSHITGDVRSYAHCSRRRHGKITLLLLNVDNSVVQVNLQLDDHDVNMAKRVEYHLTATNGKILGKGMSLNGVPLVLKSETINNQIVYRLPSLRGRFIHDKKPVTLAGHSFSFIEINAKNPLCF